MASNSAGDNHFRSGRTFEMSDDEILAEDAKQYPGCHYSTSNSTSCRTINGESKCETIKRIFRHCPNQPKTEILKKSESEDYGGGQVSKEMERFGFGGGEGEEVDPFEAFGEMNRFHSMMRGMMGSFGGFFGHSPFGDEEHQSDEGAWHDFASGGVFEREMREKLFRRRGDGEELHPPHHSDRGKSGDGAKDKKGGSFWFNRRQPNPEKNIFEGYDGKVEEV